MEREEILVGGNSTTVARVGATVRRAVGPWTPQVNLLLAHLRARGIHEAPEPLGFDRQGRAILSYIPGTVGHFPQPELRTDAVLVAAAQLLRRLHDATVDVAQVWRGGWQAPTREPVEVICHGDYALYNLVFDHGKLVGVIDFDHAHPGERAWDLAYAIYRFAPITDPTNPEHDGSLAEQCRRARLFCDAYGLRDRSRIAPSIAARIAFMAEYLRQGAANGNERLQANIDEGHLAIYTTDHAYFATHCTAFQAALE